jgi:regulator-associated protein of mTOR
LCLAKFWEGHEEGKKEAIREKAHVQLCALLSDPVPEVRAAAVYALGTFISRTGQVQSNDARTIIDLNLGLTFAVVTGDASPLVRKELVVALSALVNAYEDKFKQIEMKWMRSELPRAPVAPGLFFFLGFISLI